MSADLRGLSHRPQDFLRLLHHGLNLGKKMIMTMRTTITPQDWNMIA